MEKFISVYQFVKYLKGEIMDDEVLILLSKTDKETRDYYNRNIDDPQHPGWSRLQFLLFIKPDMNHKMNGYGWWYMDINGDPAVPDLPLINDNYYEVPTKILIDYYYSKYGKGKWFTEIPHPKELIKIKKGGRWRNKGKALKMSA